MLAFANHGPLNHDFWHVFLVFAEFLLKNFLVVHHHHEINVGTMLVVNFEGSFSPVTTHGYRNSVQMISVTMYMLMVKFTPT